MGHTKETANLKLSQFITHDKPTYLGDYNSDMKKIDDGFLSLSNRVKKNEDDIAGLQKDCKDVKQILDGYGSRITYIENNYAKKTDLSAYLTKTKADTLYESKNFITSSRVFISSNSEVTVPVQQGTTYMYEYADLQVDSTKSSSQWSSYVTLSSQHDRIIFMKQGIYLVQVVGSPVYSDTADILGRINLLPNDARYKNSEIAALIAGNHREQLENAGKAVGATPPRGSGFIYVDSNLQGSGFSLRAFNHTTKTFTMNFASVEILYLGGFN